MRGENHSALNFAQQALSALSTPRTGDPGSGLAITINNVLGMVYSNLEAFETAERYFRTCAALTLEQGHASAFVTASVNLLECLSRGGRNDEACREIERLIAHPDYRTLITPHVLNTAGRSRCGPGGRRRPWRTCRRPGRRARPRRTTRSTAGRSSRSRRWTGS